MEPGTKTCGLPTWVQLLPSICGVSVSEVIFFLAGLLFADTLLDSVGIVQLADFGALACGEWGGLGRWVGRWGGWTCRVGFSVGKVHLRVKGFVWIQWVQNKEGRWWTQAVRMAVGLVHRAAADSGSNAARQDMDCASCRVHREQTSGLVSRGSESCGCL